MPDIDIDFFDRNLALEILPHIPASRHHDGSFAKHPSGAYFQNIPVDPVTGLASLTFHEAEALGYFKVDLLNNTAYQGVRDEAHLNALRQREPQWELLADREIVAMLPHIHDYFEIVSRVQPKSVLDLALVLALIRPGKSHLLELSRATLDQIIWQPSDTYFFKKSHAVAYAVSIVVKLNLIVEEATNG